MTTTVSTLAEEVALLHCSVHQPGEAPALTREPVSAVRPHQWRWSELQPYLDRIIDEIPLEPGGDRRTLGLVNPGLQFGATHTLVAAIQQVLPGEVATAHRHTPSAFRFIIDAKDIYTTVDGERCPMDPGDVLLTPNWCWHDHQNDGDARAVWLDGLDVPLVRQMNAMFYEPYPEDCQPISNPPDAVTRQFSAAGLVPPKSSAPFMPVYKWAATLEALHALAGAPPSACDDVILEYRNPLTGGPAMRTIGLAMQLLRPGVHTWPHRHSSSTVYQAVRGSGVTTVNGTRFAWNERDFVVVPPWAWHEHGNASSTEEAILFQFNDEPALRALGLYREQEEGGTVVIS
jgi:gentisate 1,2-dioxygenase